MLYVQRIVVVTDPKAKLHANDGVKQRVLAEHFEIRSDTTGATAG